MGRTVNNCYALCEWTRCFIYLVPEPGARGLSFMLEPENLGSPLRTYDKFFCNKEDGQCLLTEF